MRRQGKPKRLVVSVISTDYAPYREELRGIADAARRFGWTLETIDNYFLGDGWARQNLDILEKADGVIARHRDSLADGTLSALGIPLVGLDVDLRGQRGGGIWTAVNCDNAAVAGAAARELLATGRKCFAVVTPPKRFNWTRLREKAFLERIRAAGCMARRYNPATEWDWVAERKSLSQWLARLPRPFGVFAPNDRLAKFALEACAAAGLDVPRDAAIIGADDDATYCLAVKPNLSSVRIDFEGAGRLSAEMLQRLMDEVESAKATPRTPRWTLPPNALRHPHSWRGSNAPRKCSYGVLGVARRASTRTGPSSGADPRLQDGLDYISGHFGDPQLGVGNVAKAMGVELRQAYRIFAATGRTIRQHIEETRLTHLQELLATTNSPISGIAAKCGFSSASYFCDFCHAHLGCSPTAWRMRNARLLRDE